MFVREFLGELLLRSPWPSQDKTTRQEPTQKNFNRAHGPIKLFTYKIQLTDLGCPRLGRPQRKDAAPRAHVEHALAGEQLSVVSDRCGSKSRSRRRGGGEGERGTSGGQNRARIRQTYPVFAGKQFVFTYFLCEPHARRLRCKRDTSYKPAAGM